MELIGGASGRLRAGTPTECEDGSMGYGVSPVPDEASRTGAAPDCVSKDNAINPTRPTKITKMTAVAT